MQWSHLTNVGGRKNRHMMWIAICVLQATDLDDPRGAVQFAITHFLSVLGLVHGPTVDLIRVAYPWTLVSRGRRVPRVGAFCARLN